jgi:Gpi18-like mannosyltransferase
MMDLSILRAYTYIQKKQCLTTFGKAIHPNSTGIFWCPTFGFNMTGGIVMILYKPG